MSPATINTILNTAPMVLQGANKLIRLIRERSDENAGAEASSPDSIEGVRQELEHIHNRLDANDESDVEQIQLIEQLAKQNEAIAESLRRAYRLITVLTIVSVVAALAALVSLLLLSRP